jgi:hypothetical protein
MGSAFKNKYLKFKAGEAAGTPALLVIKKGELVGRVVGAVSLEKLLVIAETGKLPEKPVNPEIAALSEETREKLLKKSQLLEELRQAQIKIQRISPVIESGNATDDDHVERGIYLEKARKIAQEIEKISFELDTNSEDIPV